MNLDAALHTFTEESRELLGEMETALLAGAQLQDRAEAVNAIFRAAHTIKGSAGLFGLDHIVAFTHAVESLLDEVRAGHLHIGEDLTVLLLSCCDHLVQLVEAVEAGRTLPSEHEVHAGAALMAQLARHQAGPAPAPLQDPAPQAGAPAPANPPRAGAPAPADPPRAGAPAPADPPQAGPDAAAGAGRGADAREHWHLSLRFGPDVLRHGMDPLGFLRYLQRLGRIVSLCTLADALPPPAQMDPETCYLGFEIAFASTASKAEIEGVFEFVRDECSIGILAPHSRSEEYVALIQSLPGHALRLGEILVGCGSITQRELDEALALQAGSAARLAREPARPGEAALAVPPIGSILVGQQAVAPEVVEAALVRQRQQPEARSAEARSLRIDADKLDGLINLVGELIIAGASANLLAHQTHHSQLQEATSRMSGLVQQVRDSALQLRMVKIGATFSRFQRVVHDVAREIGKDIRLQLSGEDTELDKTVVEKIGDPLLHLVRNAIDHGIEPAELRAARGKPAQGTVRLNAFHDSGSIVIEVSDDGGGLPRERILAKAIERGLVEPEQRLTDAEVLELIFEPGFSTAEQVTNLSGRGVGMDVVKRNIGALRGTVSLRSEPGLGTTVTVRLPLTLAIIDGFLVSAGGSVFVVPLDMVEECIELASEPGQAWCNLRGQVLPQVRLRDHFEIEAPPPRRESVVVIQQAGQRFGLVVDSLMGEFQTVIKPLSRVFAQVKSISGSTILGSGEVALILDVAALVADIVTPSARASPAHG
ncbi:MAG: chemotaxis protein CheA [Burkholderiales bacterium]|nr:chemotaxis protein CheA [Burkholderiales bacterium]